MKGDPQCQVCKEAATRIAVDQLREQNLSIRAVAQRVRRSKSSVERHLKHAEKPSRRGKRAKREAASQAGRAGQDRCESCGVSMTSTDPEALLKRAERLLWIAETIAAKAQADDDARLALQAVDRARAALETMMRATGQIGGDGTTVNVALVDERAVMAKIARLSVDDMRAIAASRKCEGCEDCRHCGLHSGEDVIEGQFALVDANDNRALSDGTKP